MDKLFIPPHELEFEVTRSSGPGGQNVNRTNSAVILRWNLYSSQATPAETLHRLIHKLQNRLTVNGELLIKANEFRDQLQNKSAAMVRLQEILDRALFVPKPRKATKPTRSSKRKRVESKRNRSEIKSGRKKVGWE